VVNLPHLFYKIKITKNKSGGINMEKKIENIFCGVNYEVLNFVKDIKEFGEIHYDSRKIKQNDIFAAMEGFTVDGHNYIDSALEKGASMIIVSKNIEIKNKNVIYIKIDNLRDKLGTIASNYYERPQDKLKIAGVTGTNGKTTTTYILEHVIGKTSRLGTIEYKIGDEIMEAPNTTPESLDVVKMCKKTLEKNIENLVMEVSSHALELGRVNMLKYDAAIFTNLTQDHLDFHKNMENYYKAKYKLFSLLKDNGKGIINIDDEWGKRIVNEKPCSIITYSINGEADLKGRIIEYTNHNMKIEIEYESKKYSFETELMGKFNLYNIMGATGALIAMGYKIEYIVEKLKSVPKVPGRFETINKGQNFMAVVDYAHTDDGLINILQALTEIKTERIITVFGAGGDRDKTKRPKMAKAAAKYSDYVIITSDNPRTENPEMILKDIKAGMEEIKFSEDKYKTIIDREEAIKYAVSMMKKNDILLVAGKGHETYQIIGRDKIHFDDREMLRKYI